MKDERKNNTETNETAADSGARRPYAPPAIEEEAVFESLAMSCDGANPKVCGSPSSS